MNNSVGPAGYERYPLLSSVLTQWLEKARKLGIYVESEFEQLPAELPVAEQDFAELAAALIDCGIASCRALEEPGGRWISPRFCAQGGVLHAECSAAGVPADLTNLTKKAESCGGWIRVDQYDDSYNLHFEVHRHYIILIDPFPQERAELAKLIRANLPGRVDIRQYGDPGSCPLREIRRCHAVFITLNSVEDVVKAYSLHPNGDKWPLIVVTNHERFGLEAHALWARSFLLRPVTAGQVGEALRRCIEAENTI